MIDTTKGVVPYAMLSGIAALLATQTFAGDPASADGHAISETIEVVESYELYKTDSTVSRVEVNAVLRDLALEEQMKLEVSSMDAYGQLVSELEMYDDGTRVVDSETEARSEAMRTNFLPSS